MSDDFVAGGILPVDEAKSGDTEFDPDAVESDLFLDDPKDETLLGLDVDDLTDVIADQDDELLEESVS